jgi:ankyrin repeat and BTB/POZ domain-containing protein 1
MLDEEGEISAAAAEELADKAEADGEAHAARNHPEVALGEGEGVVTLDGGRVGDEFDADTINYQILLEKIDKMLDRLQLDA